MNNHMIHERLEFADFPGLIEYAGNQYGERTAFSHKLGRNGKGLERISFAEFRNDVRALTSRLIKMNIVGKHCVAVGKMSYDWAVLYFSVIAAGGVLVPLDRDWSAEELAETAASADASLLFCDEELSEKAEAISAAVKLEHEPFWLLSDNSRSVSYLIEEGRAVFENDRSSYFDRRTDPMALALLVFTSGTTGKGKGVMLSQNAILSDMSSVIPYIDFSQKTVSVLPPHHTYGSSVMLVGHTMVGCEVYISSGIRYVQKELREQSPGHLILVPLYLETFYRKIWATIKDEGKEGLVRSMIKLCNALRLPSSVRARLFSSIHAAFGGRLKTVVSGGAPLNPDVLGFFSSVGISVLNGYGITECAPIIAVNRSKNVVAGSVGDVIDPDEVIIDCPDENGEGEILVKGPNVMLGYYKDSAATDEAMTGEFFRTGDYGRLEGRILYITGRKKNLIILSNGKNVYPEEIENQLNAIPGILDLIVYEGQSKRGISHNAIVAEIFPDAEYFEKNSIDEPRAYLKSKIDEYNKTAVAYKKIGVMKLRTVDFPKNTLRKIMRFKLDMTID